MIEARIDSDLPRRTRSRPAGDESLGRGSEPWSPLDPDTQALIRTRLVKQTVAKHSLIAREGDSQKSLIWLCEGTLCLSTCTTDGRRRILALGFPGDLLSSGDASLFWASDAETATDCTLAMLDPAASLLLRQRGFALESLLLRQTATQMNRAHRHIALLGASSAIQRLSRFLISLEEHLADQSWADGYLHLPLQRAEIADYLGLQVETVSRAFRRLSEQGVIELMRPTVIGLLDRARLLELAGLEPQSERSDQLHLGHR